ncbi:MAG: DNA mismatch repair protein MutS [Clostridia bacterium]|nr:DNA mismatch repair protein MutS [Clostridia bacterium]
MAEMSPMIKQYLEIKSQNDDSILFFRVGDFYEMFFDDAKTASDELDLVLTGKDCGQEERAPMCGVPYHSCEAYIARLVEKGHKVAICEQVEDPATAKSLVKRDVIRVITPGTVIEDNMLEEGRNNYLAAVAVKETGIGLCFTDASTGECHVTEIPSDSIESGVCDELMRFSPREILVGESLKTVSSLLWDFIGKNLGATVTVRPERSFDTNFTEPIYSGNFGVSELEGLGIERGGAKASAFGAVIEYLYETGKSTDISVNKIDVYSDKQFMRLDMTAIRNLEITETMRSKSKKGSLLWVLDKTRTAMGKRLMRSWMEKPLLNITQINLRQNAVEELCADTVLRGELSEGLSGVRDVERIITKTVYGTASPKDLLAISATAHRFPIIKNLLADSKCKLLKEICNNIDTLEDISSLIDSAISEKASIAVRDGNIIKDGYNEEVDRLRSDMKHGTGFIDEIEARERERTGIKNLRVRYNKVFGYYIEVTNSFLDKVPEDYIRKQTLTNCERFITEELKGIEKRVLTAKDRIVQIEYELFDGVRKKAAAELKRFQQTASAIAKIDVLRSFAEVSVNNRYVRPLVNDGGTVRIIAGRHPVVEQVISTPFVANDTLLNMQDDRCAVITGPNMAGKSTYMRQVAIIVLMAQTGCFVPAQSAEIGLVDAIFTRVGASDDLAAGKSTFMVEMSEVADILKNATKKSLLILDEIGRGTSTFDGMSIARAVLEYVNDKKRLGAKALFATHYHELTEMENELSGIKNYNIAVKKRGDDITFLRKIIRGGADDSYGIEVAKLSGIPNEVIQRAKQILKKTESEGIVTYKTAAPAEMQLPIEMQQAEEIMDELKTLDVNTLTPIEAMQILFDFANKAKSL